MKIQNLTVLLSLSLTALLSGSVMAAPPTPTVVVEPGENPIRVTQVRMPTSGFASCRIESNDEKRAAHCDIEIINEMPEGMDTFVLERISIEMKSRNQDDSFDFTIFSRANGGHYRNPESYLQNQKPSSSSSSYNFNEEVTIYHDGIWAFDGSYDPIMVRIHIGSLEELDCETEPDGDRDCDESSQYVYYQGHFLRVH